LANGGTTPKNAVKPTDPNKGIESFALSRWIIYEIHIPDPNKGIESPLSPLDLSSPTL